MNSFTPDFRKVLLKPPDNPTHTLKSILKEADLLKFNTNQQAKRKFEGISEPLTKMKINPDLKCSFITQSKDDFDRLYAVNWNRKLGGGSFGTVYECTSLDKSHDKNSPFAVKIGNKTENSKNEAALQLYFSKNMVGPYVPDHFYFEDQFNFYLVMEQMDSSVSEYIKGYLNEYDWKQLELSIMNLVDKQKVLDILCSDQKPENMLIRKNPFKIVLSDFDTGFCCSMTSTCMKQCQSTSTTQGDFNYILFQIAVLCKNIDPEKRLMFKVNCYSLYNSLVIPSKIISNTISHYLYSSHPSWLQKIIKDYTNGYFETLIQFWLEFDVKQLFLMHIAIK